MNIKMNYKNITRKGVFTTHDFPEFSALNCPSDDFPAIEEVDIKQNPINNRQFDFIFEDSSELRRKLDAFRKGRLRVEPLLYGTLCKQIKQELRYLSESI